MILRRLNQSVRGLRYHSKISKGSFLDPAGIRLAYKAAAADYAKVVPAFSFFFFTERFASMKLNHRVLDGRYHKSTDINFTN